MLHKKRPVWHVSRVSVSMDNTLRSLTLACIKIQDAIIQAACWFAPASGWFLAISWYLAIGWYLTISWYLVKWLIFVHQLIFGNRLIFGNLRIFGNWLIFDNQLMFGNQLIFPIGLYLASGQKYPHPAQQNLWSDCSSAWLYNCILSWHLLVFSLKTSIWPLQQCITKWGFRIIEHLAWKGYLFLSDLMLSGFVIELSGYVIES